MSSHPAIGMRLTSITLLLSFLRVAALQVTCPDSSMPIQWCPQGLCPPGYFCYYSMCCRKSLYGGKWNSGWHYGPHGFWNSRMTLGWNSGWNFPHYGGGMCPKMYDPMMSNFHQCHSDSQCPGGQLCCRTTIGKRCLLPVLI
uniref:WAP domain-containing protein n=1 Tax=Trichuris muris TaxID=70415 RepID=A0A5S6QYB4_TRIMR